MWMRISDISNYSQFRLIQLTIFILYSIYSPYILIKPFLKQGVLMHFNVPVIKFISTV